MVLPSCSRFSSSSRLTHIHLLLHTLGEWEGDLRLSYTAVIVVVELIELVSNHPLSALTLQVCAIILKGVKVLGHTLYQLLEARIRCWASSVP